ncbi:glycosyltransferase [Wenzhouxiangella limi]|uniref:sucrose-phosphate synthase n=1 Tax=Wenzhouxiangella limi TaxID=2707351 RepID=A0A845UZY6_9GAMM|nr:glycosyltransferase [Wenzhouxiangella limi]NDY94616.1 glycosyltransferase family 1 protein [Wenzhouxiangella limi]
MRIVFLNPQGNFDRTDAYLTEHPDFGGQLVYVKEVALALGRLGVDVDIITRRIRDPEWQGFEQMLDDFGQLADRVRIVRLPCGGDAFLAKEALWPHLPEMADAIADFYADKAPDFLTAHYADGGYLAVLLKARMGLGFTFTGHSLGAQKLDKLISSTGKSFESLDDRYRFSQRIDAERLAMADADTIIASTSDERMSQYGHPLYTGAIEPTDDRRFRVIPPGINSAIFHADSSLDERETLARLRSGVRNPGRPHVVVASRLDPKKNVAGVVEAFCRSPELASGADLALFVRGVDDPWAGIEALRADEQAVLGPILDRIRQAGLIERVSFVNARSQRELAAGYRLFAASGSVFALPSLFEPFGLAPIEAAACGLAVVATRNGGPSEIFAGGAGVLMDPEDPEDMGRAFLEGLDRYPQLARAGIERVLSTYTWDKTAAAYLEQIETNRGIGVRAMEGAVPVLDASRRIRAYLDKA